MGLDIQRAKFLSFGRELGVDYSATPTFGRQHVVINNKPKILPESPDKLTQAIISE